jgi:hypothetical protein
MRFPQPGEPEQCGPIIPLCTGFPFCRLLRPSGLRWRYSNHLHTGLLAKSKSKLYYDRQSVCQSVLVSGTHLGPATNFSHSLFDYFLDSFEVCWCGVPSLTGHCQTLPAQPFSGLGPEHSLLSLFLRLPQPGGPSSCIYFPQEQGSTC